MPDVPTSTPATLPATSPPPATHARRKRPILKAVLLASLAIVGIFLVVVALQPAEFQVERQATFSATPDAVFALVNDFHRWPDWSPWAKLDPQMKQSIEGAGKGATYSWSGNSDVGEGRMTMLESRPGELIQIQLDFIKPFASTAMTRFTFQPQGPRATVVTWRMSGRNDFIGKAFCLFMNMDKMIGTDFEKGLASMKSLAEAPAPR